MGYPAWESTLAWETGLTWFNGLIQTFSETLTIADVVIKQPQKSFGETLTIADTIIKQPKLTFAETLTIDDAAIPGLLYFKTFAETLTISATIPDVDNLEEYVFGHLPPTRHPS